jgi:enoyl-CoA hydratase/carnithine racemase
MSEIRLSRPRPDVAVVTIDRQARRNACNLAAWQGLARNFRELSKTAPSAW